ncbi:NUDIX hydrolase [Peptacetobacter sp.]|uniref:NUDIX hydrolase n=1 Tax=Peptacetobacter sp. TaxID=2991975 RepID=UPI002E77FCAA|nr:NUDIX hydrolase [Peptacetobacter sp.]MEE0451871.1 NUDIX hydrolase [Peptacetobacter sp.]
MRQKKVKKLTPIRKSKYLSMYEMKYESKDKSEKSWMLATRKSEEELNNMYFGDGNDRDDAVVMVPYHIEEDKLVIIREYRVPLDDYVYSLPAGLIDPGEDIEVCARRELKEETGLDLVEINKMDSGFGLYPSPGMTDESFSLLYCTCKGEPSNEYLEPTEEIQTLLIDRQQAVEILKSKSNMDVKAFLALQIFIAVGKDNEN